jgi:SsrA-binding protein
MIITQNKKINLNYDVIESFEAGIQLKGTEIKSIRLGKISINEAYAMVKNQEVFLLECNISKYESGNIFNHKEKRDRKLLLHKKEILKIQGKVQQDHLTLVPRKVYFKDSLVKVEICLCRGKKNYDRREDLKEKDSKIRMEKTLSHYRY